MMHTDTADSLAESVVAHSQAPEGRVESAFVFYGSHLWSLRSKDKVQRFKSIYEVKFQPGPLCVTVPSRTVSTGERVCSISVPQEHRDSV